jgi:hypothetical protein
MNNYEKKINIVGTNTRYQMKKVIKNEEGDLVKIRREIDKLELPLDTFEWEQQHHIINEIYDNLKNNAAIKTHSDIIKIVKNQISNKLSGYKHQDVIKKVFDREKIIKYEEIIEKLKNCDLKCYYCNENVYLLYKLVREMNQWSLDRINNDIGHNGENVFISCLECNLKKRTKNSDSFLFTKQLKINKMD